MWSVYLNEFQISESVCARVWHSCSGRYEQATQLFVLLSLKRDSDSAAWVLVLHHWLFLTAVSSLMFFSKTCVNYFASRSRIPSYLKLSVKVLSFLLWVILPLLLYLRIKKSAKLGSLRTRSTVYVKSQTHLLRSVFQDAVERLQQSGTEWKPVLMQESFALAG